MKKILFIFGAFLLAASCKTGDEPLLAFQAFLTAEKGILYGDYGDSYVPTTNPGIDYNSGRYFISAYTTEDLGNNKYKATVTSATNASVENPLVNSQIEDQKLIGFDGVQTTLGYAAGKYLNLRIEYLYADPKAKHLINLVYNDAKSNKDTLYFELRHQANKDTLSVGKTMYAVCCYTSFDISRYACTDKSKMIVCLKNKWYRTSTSGYLPELEDCTICMEYAY